MNNTTKLIHNELLERISILNDGRLLQNLLSECLIQNSSYSSNYKAKARQLMSAFECGVVETLLSIENRDEFLRHRLTTEVINCTGYEKSAAEWIVDTWLLCIDGEIIQLWNDYKNTLESEKQNQEYDPNMNEFNEPNQYAELPDGIFIPCGVGNEDNGFVVCGLNQSASCNDSQESIYAVIFNYLQRSTTIDEKRDKPQFIKKYEAQLHFDIDYKQIYRLTIVILLMIKYNYLNNDVLSFKYDGNFEELKIVFKNLNNYIILLSKLIGIENPKTIKYKEDSKILLNLNSPKQSGIYVVENKGAKRQDRMIWYAPKIYYKITDENKTHLEYLLREISEFKSFKVGQFEAIQHMLNTRDHNICIMPTGSGKSLIFYLCTLLQPGVSFVIAPTELLINDQLENLKKYHRIDDAKHLIYGGEDNFKNLQPQNKIYYLTPETFQNRDLLKEFIILNSSKKISNIILDEVHCISNWSHDFRPEYLMLSTYLNRYLDRTYYLCFTATANYSVIKDIKNQLLIRDDKNIISPIKLEKDNINYKFICCDNFDDMCEKSLSFLRKNLIKGQKTLVFTKNEKISNLLYEQLDEIQYETEVYRQNDKSAYKNFADGKCKILIASGEIGIGINLSDVHNVLHFGLPLSKGEYVQEIGRAGRNGERASSQVIYLRCNDNNVDSRLLQRTTETSEIIDVINNSNNQDFKNDYLNTYQKLIGDINSQDEFTKLVHDVFDRIKNIKDSEEIEFNLENINKTKKALYILFVIGYVNNWSFCDIRNNKITMLIGLRKNCAELDSIKEKTKDYLYTLGDNKKSIAHVSKANSIEEIIDIYIDWYYNHFIYHHKEQFLDMISFIESYKSGGERTNFNVEINKRLAAYFSLSMLEISKDEEKYTMLTFRNIVETIISGVDYNTVSNIQRINQDNNNLKLDYFLFVYSIVCDEEYDESRIKRILTKVDEEDYYEFIESISMVYEKATDENKFNLFRDISNYISKSGGNYADFFDMIFRTNKKDSIYFGVLAKKINCKLGGIFHV